MPGLLCTGSKIVLLYIPLDVVTYLSNATADHHMFTQRAPECIGLGRNGIDGKHKMASYS